MDFIISPQLLTMGDAQSLSRLYKDFISKDYFMLFRPGGLYCGEGALPQPTYDDGTPGAAGCWSILPALDSFPPDRTIAEYDSWISGI
ncbi:MAG: hypothetical protein ACLU9R_07330 [Faecalibacterium sp.]